MNYRPDIDGLRAVAVIPVVFFHAGFNIFGGGFVGVDVFFVISGFLITSLIMEEFDRKCFNIINFYERRAKRIIPSLFFVMAIFAPFAYILMLPDQLTDFSKSLIYAALFISNIYYWRQSGYFDPISEEQPFLHTWSLAVEAQYYLLFPVFFLFGLRLRKNKVFWLIIFCAAASFFLSEWGWRNRPSANFYLAPTRIWEFLVGSIAAFHLENKSIKKKSIFAIIGLSLIIVSVFLYGADTPFPSAYSIIPVLGAYLFIVHSKDGTIATSFLSHKAISGIGIISYPVYLWHQPIFAFARIGLEHEPSKLTMILLVFLSFILSYGTWRYIEAPFRRRQKNKGTSLYKFPILAMIFFIIFGFGGVYTNGFRDRYDNVLSYLKYISFGERIHIEGYPCSSFSDAQYGKLLLCEYGDLNSNEVLVTYGDSHLDAINFEFDAFAEQNHIRVIKATIAGCGVIFDITSMRETSNLGALYEHCNEGFAQLRRLILSYNADVMVVSRWTFQMYPAPGFVEQLAFDNGVGGHEDNLQYRENRAFLGDGTSSIEWDDKERALLKLLNGLASVSNRLFVNYPIPEMGWNIFEENLNSIRETGHLVQTLRYPSSVYYHRNFAVINVLDNVAESNGNVYLIRSDQTFCQDIDANFCVGQVDDDVFYLDDDHLSDRGAQLFLNEFSDILLLGDP